jgi:hypothetical protein
MVAGLTESEGGGGQSCVRFGLDQALSPLEATGRPGTLQQIESAGPGIARARARLASLLGRFSGTDRELQRIREAA